MFFPVIQIVWLLFGSDLKMHMYREDPTNCSYFEDDTIEHFSEFANIMHVVMWFDVKYINNLSRWAKFTIFTI